MGGFKMAATMKNADNDTQVTFEDQQKINKFARHNARLQDLKDELDNRKKELQNFEDAENELLMREDESDLVPYRIGEVFVSLKTEEANEYLEKAKELCQKDIEKNEEQSEIHKKILQDLKVELYAKFGTNINL